MTATPTESLKSHALSALLFLLVGVCIFSNFGEDYFTGKWIGFLGVAVLLAMRGISDKYGIPAAALFGCVVTSALFQLLSAHSRYIGLGEKSAYELRSFITASLIKFLVIVSPFLVLDVPVKTSRKVGSSICCGFFFISLGMVYFDFFTKGCTEIFACGGAVVNPSMNASAIMVTMPFVFDRMPKSIKPLPIALAAGSLFMMKSSIGIGMFCVATALLSVQKITLSRASAIRALAAVAIAAVIFLLSYLQLGPRELFSNGDRFKMWRFFLSHWNGPRNWWFGTGFGTFGAIGKSLQADFDMNPDQWWPWMHNDWADGLFEMGYTGLFLMLATFTHAALRMFRAHMLPELQALLLLGIMMTVNFPDHVGITAFFAAWILSVGLYKEKWRGKDA